MKRAVALLCLASAAFLAPAGAAPAAGAALKARVVRLDGRPLSERWVYVVWNQGAPFRFEGRDRKVLNPRARTGRDGTLAIEVPAGFFDPSDELALAWEEMDGRRSHFTALHDADGKRLRFRLEAVGRERDFGELIAPNPEPD